MTAIRPGFMAAFASLFMVLGACVFFLIQIPYGYETKIAVWKQDCGDGPRAVYVHALESGQVLLNGEPLERDKLGDRLHAIFSTRVERVVFFSADPGLSFEGAASVIDLARVHVDYVALLTPSVQNTTGACLTFAMPPVLDYYAGPRPPVHVKEVPLWQIWKR